MRKSIRLSRVVALVAALALALAACGSDDDDGTSAPSPTDATDGDATDGDATDGDEPADPVEITIALGSNIDTMDSQGTNNQWVKVVHYGNVSETLTTLDAEGGLIPLLAKSWELVDDDTWRFELQEGATFHNGEPFDAAAAVFSLERITSEGVASHVGFFAAYDSSEVVDDYTIDVHTNAPAPDFPGKLTFAPMVPPEHTQSAEDAPDTDPIGTGPYMIETRALDEVVMVKNPDYWGGEVAGPDKVTVVSRPEDSARIAAVQTGEAHIVSEVPPQLFDDAPKTVVISGPAKFTIPLNPWNGVTQDPLVREAIVLAIDNEGIRQALLPDLSAPGECQFPVDGITGYHPGLENQPYDPDRARELLDEAGAVGETVSFAVPAARYQQGEEAAEIVVEQLRAVGLEVDLQVTDFQTWIDTIFQPREERVNMWFIGASYDSGSVTQPWGQYVDSTTGFEHFPADEFPEFAEQLASAISNTDPEEREQELRAVAETVCDSHAYVWLYTPNLVYGVADEVSFPARRDERLPFQDIEVAS